MLNASEKPKPEPVKLIESSTNQGQSSKDWQAAVAAAGYKLSEPALTTASAGSHTAK
jgi:hypothetical protein